MRLTILLVNNKNPLHKIGGSLIKFVEKTNFEHVAILAEFEEANYVYHAVYPKVQRESLASFSQRYALYKKYDFEIQDLSGTVYNYLQIMNGRQYSVSQLLLIYLRRISSAINKLSNGWILNHEHKMICSEIAAMALSDFLGVKFSSKPDSIGLREIEEACDKLKGDKV